MVWAEMGLMSADADDDRLVLESRAKSDEG